MFKPKQELINDWSDMLQNSKSTPYVFRTRLERAIQKTDAFARLKSDVKLGNMAKEILDKLSYISDQSNQTSDGCLNSFNILKDDIENIKNYLEKEITEEN